jgi:hypothetical protein
MSDYSLDLLYLGKISPTLKSFKQKSPDLWHCRCEICGDSARNKFKVRGAFFRQQNIIMYKCLNCEATHPLWRYIKLYHNDLYRPYLFAKFKEKETPSNVNDTPRIPSALPHFPQASLLGHCIPIADLLATNAAKRYCEYRRIPRVYQESLLYTENFKTLCEAASPDKAKELRDEPRIVIPYYDANKQLIGFQGRSLVDKDKLRYITMKLTDEPMIYGLDTVDLDKRVHVFEGPFDSMFIDNSIAVSGSALLKIDIDDAVYIHDNQPRNKEIVEIMKKSIDANKRVVVWPSSFTHKDINDAIIAGMSAEDIALIINKSSYRGLEARLKYSQWKKI